MLPLSEIPNDVDRGTSGTYPACIRRVGLPRPPNSPKNSRPCVEPLRRSPGPRSSCTCSPSTGTFFLSDLYVLVTWAFPAPQRLLKGETFLFGQTSTTNFSLPRSAVVAHTASNFNTTMLGSPHGSCIPLAQQPCQPPKHTYAEWDPKEHRT
jgi:hypothetical protein